MQLPCDTIGAGTDPYASKGTVDVMRPQVRPDGHGGCLR